MSVEATFPLLFGGGAVRLGSAQPDLVVAGWGLSGTRGVCRTNPTPTLPLKGRGL